VIIITIVIVAVVTVMAVILSVMLDTIGFQGFELEMFYG